MGVVKRIQGWRDSRWPIPNTLQMLVGLIPYRDPEAYLERKRAAREAARERTAIREADRIPAKTASTPLRGPPLTPGGLGKSRSRIGPAGIGPSLDSMREQIDAELTESMQAVITAYFRGELKDSPDERELPVRAQPGWYRLDRTFYRIGQGPFADWVFRDPATEQGLLF